MRSVVPIFLCLTISIGLFLLPSAIWTFSTRNFNPTLLEFMGFVFMFSVVIFIGPFNLRLPDWLGNPPGLYLLNLIPIAVISLVAYLILHRSTKLSRAKSACIAINASILLIQAMGSLMLYFFGRYSGP